MAYFNTCPHCGATLDPGEKCECIAEKEERRKKWESLTKNDKDGQLAFKLTTREVKDE
jgi:transcription initiation factor IIE alpha subunit